MLNVGIIGLRGHQGIILEGITQMDDVHLTAVAEPDESLLSNLKDHPAVTPETRFYTDYRELLDNEDIQVAGVTGTDNTRADVACECAGRGLHLMTEKPLSIDLDGLERVKAAVKKAGVRLTIMISMRYSPAFVAMKKAVAEGLVGTVCQMTMQKSYRLGERPDWMKSRETFSGIIPFIGIHALDLMQYTSGRQFTQVMAYQANVAHPEIRDLQDCASLVLKLDNGGSATARLDYLRPAAAPTHADDRLRIAGDKGVIEVIGDDSKPYLITSDHSGREIEVEPAVNHFVDFVQAIKTGGDCLAPEDDCYRITEIVLKARESAETASLIDL